MNAKAIVCVVVGCRWETTPDDYETFTVLTCKRCGRRQELGADTRLSTDALRATRRSWASYDTKPITLLPLRRRRR